MNLSEDWKSRAGGFIEKWNFLHCVGNLDGKHINIILSNGSGSEVYNYKSRRILVLLAIMAVDYQFTMCVFGTNGRVSDGGVLQNTSFLKSFRIINPRR